MRLPSFASLALALASGTSSLGAQSVQYRSPAGIEYRARADTGPIARATRAVAESPRDVQRYIALGTAQAGARQMREAVETFTRALAVAPNDAMLYRWRGHRHLSVRELDRAMADLTRGLGIDSTNYGILYHLGIVRFVRGDFNGAADAFARALPRAPDAGELAGSTDWLWMSLARAGRAREAAAHLARRTDTLPTTNAYARRLRLYRGELAPAAYWTASDTGDTDVATLAYGLGNWYLVRGDTARAHAQFERSVQSGGWPAFGFIASEAELARLAATASGARAGDDRAAVVVVVQRLFDAMARRDTIAARALLLPGASFVSIRGDTAGARPRTQSDTSFLRMLATGREALLERMWQPVVHVDGPVASVWTPYDFHTDGKWSHCGVDAVSLVRTAAGWRVTSIAYTVNRRDCAPSPLGPPR